VPLSDELARAEAGDVLAARDALSSIAFLLSTSNIHPTTREPLPVPPFVRDYLARAFERMAAGEVPAKALHLSGKARSWRHFDHMIGADLVAQYIALGWPVEKAAASAAEMVAEVQARGRKPGRPAPFGGRKISEATLMAWYYKLRSGG
jgi:hypothetical protein